MKNIYYVILNEPGIKRVLKGKSFQYVNDKGKIVKNKAILDRIKLLKIPPAYMNVWICKNGRGHIQAYGFDIEGRKQYLYHPAWIAKQEKYKFNHLLNFGATLPKVRKKIRQHLKLKKLCKTKILAIVTELLDRTLIRVGSPQYSSYGLLTLKKKHLKIKGSTIFLDFPGKSNQAWHLKIYNKRLADLLKRIEQKPGYKIFKYFDENDVAHALTVTDLNNYLKEISGENITAKEFRTWKGSVAFLRYHYLTDDKSTRNTQASNIKKVAKLLGNTPKVCKSSYIHPLLLNPKFSPLLAKLKQKKYTAGKYFSADEKYFLLLLNKTLHSF